jgi:DNA invertase Pin-like site-specific DNA recombinase
MVRFMAQTVGYARVSTPDQTTQLQEDALAKAGCDRIVCETASGKTTQRPQLERLLAGLEPGDTLMVWKLDRLGRSVTDLVNIVSGLHAANVGFRSLTDDIDTTTAGSRLIFHVFCVLAEFEADLTRERTMAGLAAARNQGRKGGRPTVLTPERREAIDQLHAASRSVLQIARATGISRGSVYRHLERVEARDC